MSNEVILKYGSNIERKDVPVLFQWQVQDIFPNDASWSLACSRLKDDVMSFSAFRNTLNSAENLRACLAARDSLALAAERIYAYARLYRDTDTGNQAYQALVGQAEALVAECNNAVAFVEPEILGLPTHLLKEFTAQDDGFKEYAHYLDNLLRMSLHVLSKNEEELLAKSRLATASAENIFRVLTGADMSFPPALDAEGSSVLVSEGSYLLNMTSKDRVLRKNTFKNLMDTYKSFRNTFASSLAGNCRTAAFYAQTRNFKDTLTASLAEDNIPASVFENLLSCVNDNLKPLHNYISLKKKALNLSKLHPYDIYAPLATTDAEAFAYSFPEACSIIKDCLKPLGEDYGAILEKAFASRWLDVYENRGKQSGAYSWGLYGVHPFVLLNYQPRYNSVSTIAHEMGHALHSYLSSNQQTYVNSDYTIFCAEVASTTNEIFLLEHMLKQSEGTQRIFLLCQFLEAVRTTVFRQVQFSEFEAFIHGEINEGRTLTAQNLENLWLDLNRKYYGVDFALDEELAAEWSRIPHFYRPFYVYKYATGYAAATCFAESILQESPGARENYLRFLSSGGSDYSLNLLRSAGVDLNSPEPIKALMEKFNEKLSELESLL